ncbi:hypothetical protein [Solidesulfovibrio magneticus]|uniref:N-acetyltransferase domain-containing protein n=1 Tax=Solidesulfovibrio magneticus (strain ATCC 700980 / DSM 13731 / RS-1) TaxID=573370 RepID=C4XMB7_SOLM1|nr:hypothetical protein [Solidesulfovibrio magneticus]BAH77245.1 hypothetical protein DMR_37540 [Solidesulfovibrio magneticus RS-1]
MECDIDTLRAFLETVGCPAETAAVLARDMPQTAQGLPPATGAALAAALTEALGTPAAPSELLEHGSLDDWLRFVAGHHDDAALKRAAMARIINGKGNISPGKAYTIDAMRPADAPGVAGLFHTIYDANYPVLDYYVPEKLIALNRQKAVLTLVARLETGEIAGHGAYYRSSPPNPAVYEQGQLLVDPAYRQSSMAFKLLRELDALSYAMPWAEAFFGEAVCNHLVTQKSGDKQGYTPCGIELSLMPDAAYAKEGAAGRVSCMMGWRMHRDKPSPLYLPEVYRPVLEGILSGFSLRRDIRFDPGDHPASGETVLTSRLFDLAQVERVQVAAVGHDFPARTAAIEERADRLGLAVVQVSINASSPSTAWAVRTLRQRGYVFGAFAPQWFPDGDALMLQRLAAQPDFEAVNLYTDRAKAILAHIRQEWGARGR